MKKNGFISPAGEFFGCLPWSHNYLGEEIIKSSNLWETFLEELNNKVCYSPKDFLTKRGYVGVWDPDENGRVEAYYKGRLTSAQKNTLYAYFIEMGDKEKANAIFV